MKADIFKVMEICIFFLFPRMKDVNSLQCDTRIYF